MHFVCPACKGSLTCDLTSFTCGACRLEFPVIAGIPDFRLKADPYIGIAADREKGEHLRAAALGRSFEDMVRYYYSITPEDPADLAPLRIAHALAEVPMAQFVLQDAKLLPAPRRAGALLDIGCSTAALLVAASGGFETLVGVDVAFRWLVIGQVRLREVGVEATLVCANAEALPFRDDAFGLVTATDLLEHAGDAESAVRESHRVLATGGTTYWSTNNRYALLPEPHVALWGVGYVPRRWQRAYVARRRPDLHPYHVRLRSAGELQRLFAASRFQASQVAAAPLCAPHLSGRALPSALAVYNRLRTLPGVAFAAKWLGPRLTIRARK